MLFFYRLAFSYVRTENLFMIKLNIFLFTNESGCEATILLVNKTK